MSLRRGGSSSWTLCLSVVVVVVAVGALLSLSPPASAHAFLDHGVPGLDAVVEVLPATVALTFTEPVEVRASIFKVYPLDHDDDPLRLRGQAARLVDQVLQVRGTRRSGWMWVSGLPDSESAEIQIVLQDDLPPGPYVVMWRVLSIDTHITWGHYVFTYAPTGDG